MSNSELSKYHAYRNSIRRFLLIVGIWPNLQPSYFYRCLPLLQITLCSCTVLAIIAYVRKNLNDVVLVTKGLSVMVSFLSGILKVIENFKNILSSFYSIQNLYILGYNCGGLLFLHKSLEIVNQ